MFQYLSYECNTWAGRCLPGLGVLSVSLNTPLKVWVLMHEFMHGSVYPVLGVQKSSPPFSVASNISMFSRGRFMFLDTSV